jgi:hypothetical protein
MNWKLGPRGCSSVSVAGSVSLLIAERRRGELPAAPWTEGNERTFAIYLPAWILSAIKLKLDLVSSSRLLDCYKHSCTTVSAESLLSLHHGIWNCMMNPKPALWTGSDVLDRLRFCL